MSPVTFLIKPASSRCNLACTYCFYHDEANNRSVPDYGTMDSETASVLIDRAFELAADGYTFSFQGGEPTLAGLDYFEYFVRTAREKNRKNARLHFALQTNGILVDSKWARFLAENHFLIGLSLDGFRLLHDTARLTRAGAGTYSPLKKNLSLLQREGAEVNVLCVVTQNSVDNAERIYRHFKKLGFSWVQCIPCIDPFEHGEELSPWSLSAQGFAVFFKKIFDLWFEDWQRGDHVHIRWFENLIGMAMGYPPESCGLSGRCSIIHTIEADGSVFPCDFYSTDQWYLGSIKEMPFAEMTASDLAREFVAGSTQIDPECNECPYFFLCRGGCRRNRDDGFGSLKINRFCSGYKDFFSYALERILYIADFLKSREIKPVEQV